MRSSKAWSTAVLKSAILSISQLGMTMIFGMPPEASRAIAL
ncbi:hypothetical protein FHR32_004078 [Streptosporangium album]|uniref:Uncharacterized protein n=1 Tax=Streptosporangium album TaxID=47479 RepID=A0A7W7RY83_9ACTN|nr:hypothetical protein [Streptosporangium album]MBB4939773.1 hypothetical protein [Streptosporangium album]